MEFYPCTQDNVDLSTTTLVLPSISIGNIGQLAMDLVLENDTTGTRRIGHLYHPDVLPMAGPSTDPQHALNLSMEVYMSLDGQFTYIQQRAPCASGRASAVYRDLMLWVRNIHVHSLIVLCGADATARIDEEITDMQDVRYVTLWPETFSGIVSTIKPLAKRDVPDYQRLKLSGGAEKVWDIQGGGYLARRAVRSWLDDETVNVCVVLAYGVEGDNIPESMYLAAAFLRAYGRMGTGRMKIPASWSLIYGTEQFDRELFM